jgi:putative transposase
MSNFLEQHLISGTHPEWMKIDYLCFLSSELHTKALKKIENKFLETGKVMRYKELYHSIKYDQAFEILPAATAQQNLLMTDRETKEFFEKLKKWKSDRKSLHNPPVYPFTFDEEDRFPVYFTRQQIRIKGQEIIFPKKSKLNSLLTNVKEIVEIVIVPSKNAENAIWSYVISVVHSQ